MDFIIELFRMYPETVSRSVSNFIYFCTFVLLLRGMWLILQGFFHMKSLPEKELSQRIHDPESRKDPLILVTARTLFFAHKEQEGSPYPRSFLEDATRQVVENSFETRFINSISSIANLFPPLGFIGTVFGMIFIFMAKADPNSELNTAGLGAALFTTLGALFMFLIVEVLKMILIRVSDSRITRGLKIDLS